jgi:hypothetical protein
MTQTFAALFKKIAVGAQGTWRFESQHPAGSLEYRNALELAQREYASADRAARKSAVTIIDVHRETDSGQNMVDFFQFRKTKASM